MQEPIEVRREEQRQNGLIIPKKGVCMEKGHDKVLIYDEVIQGEHELHGETLLTLYCPTCNTKWSEV